MENKLIQKITSVVAAPAVAFAIQGAKFIGKAAIPVGAGFVATSCGDDGKEDPQDQDKWYADWNIDGATIEFYKGQGVSNSEVDDIMDEFANGYAGFPTLTVKANFRNNVMEVHVTTNGTVISGEKADKTLYVGRDATWTGEIETYLGTKGFFSAKIQQKNNIMLANKELDHQNYLKHTVVLPQMAKIKAGRQA